MCVFYCVHGLTFHVCVFYHVHELTFFGFGILDLLFPLFATYIEQTLTFIWSTQNDFYSLWFPNILSSIELKFKSLYLVVDGLVKYGDRIRALIVLIIVHFC